MAPEASVRWLVGFHGCRTGISLDWLFVRLAYISKTLRLSTGNAGKRGRGEKISFVFSIRENNNFKKLLLSYFCFTGVLEVSV